MLSLDDKKRKNIKNIKTTIKKPWFPVPSRFLRGSVRRIQEIAEQAALEQVAQWGWLELIVLLFPARGFKFLLQFLLVVFPCGSRLGTPAKKLRFLLSVLLSLCRLVATPKAQRATGSES